MDDAMVDAISSPAVNIFQVSRDILRASTESEPLPEPEGLIDFVENPLI
jgi:hypothetical protein